MAEIVTGRIIRLEQDGGVLIRAAVPNIDRAMLRKYETCLCEFTDGRKISADQRKKIYAIFREIAEYTGYTESETKEVMKLDFVLNHLESICKDMFSLSNCTMTMAHEFLGFLVDFCIAHNIPTRFPLISQCEDISRYTYACLLNKKCAVCGKRADVHHLHNSRVDFGGLQWRQKNQNGAEVLPLCREHHEICHHDEEGFLARYHLQGVKIDKQIAKVYKAKFN